MKQYLRLIAALGGVGAAWSALGRSRRKGGLGRAAWSAMCAGVAVAALSLEWMPTELGGLWPFLLLVGWCGVTHTLMALSEALLAWWVVGRSRLHPGKAMRGAFFAALMGHVGGFLAFVLIFASELLSLRASSPEWLGFFVLFLPFALAGGALASLGTVYGDISRLGPKQAEGDHIPG